MTKVLQNPASEPRLAESVSSHESRSGNRSYLLCWTRATMLAVPMARHLKTDEVDFSLAAELAAKAQEIRQKYGPEIGWNELQRLLEDRDCAPFPCEIRFD